MRSTRRCFRPAPGSLKMTNALSRLSKLFGEALIGELAARCVTSAISSKGTLQLAQDVSDDPQGGQAEIQVFQKSNVLVWIWRTKDNVDIVGHCFTSAVSDVSGIDPSTHPPVMVCRQFGTNMFRCSMTQAAISSTSSRGILHQRETSSNPL